MPSKIQNIAKALESVMFEMTNGPLHDFKQQHINELTGRKNTFLNKQIKIVSDRRTNSKFEDNSQRFFGCIDIFSISAAWKP
ncbi:MAG: hypothetical protein MJ000_11175 [Bacteroidales bacterium]|nr:hypothetical protein [Bacteroidales bacterium]